MQLLKETKVTCGNVTASGTSAVNGSIVDMSGFEGVMFIVNLSVANVGNTVKLQRGAAANMSDAADLEGTETASDGTSKTIIIDLHKPVERYVRPVVTRGVATTIQSITAIQYSARTCPTDNSTSTDNTVAAFVSPAEVAA